MRSMMNLNDLRTRARNLLMDAGATVWANDQIDEGIRLALGEYSRAGLLPGARVRADEAVGLVSPIVDSRTVSLAALTGLMEVSRVWFPYDASAPDQLPEWVDFSFYWDAGTPNLLLLGPTVPDGTEVARIFYARPHSLADLDAAAETTFQAVDEVLLIWGACGHACNARSVDQAEIPGQQTSATPNYAAIGQRYLKAFRSQIAPGYVAFSKRARRQVGSRQWYDPNRLEVH